MDTFKEIMRMNQLLEVEELAFQHQLKDAVSFTLQSPSVISPRPPHYFPFIITLFC